MKWTSFVSELDRVRSDIRAKGKEMEKHIKEGDPILTDLAGLLERSTSEKPRTVMVEVEAGEFGQPLFPQPEAPEPIQTASDHYDPEGVLGRKTGMKGAIAIPRDPTTKPNLTVVLHEATKDTVGKD